GVAINHELINSNYWDVIASPIIHDSVDVCVFVVKCFSGPDRDFKYMNGVDIVAQKSWSPNDGSDMAASQLASFANEEFMTWIPCGLLGKPCRKKGIDFAKDRTLVGAVKLGSNQKK